MSKQRQQEELVENGKRLAAYRAVDENLSPEN